MMRWLMRAKANALGTVAESAAANALGTVAERAAADAAGTVGRAAADAAGTVAVVVTLLMALTGCGRTEVIEKAVYLHDTITNNVTSVETVWLRDSVVHIERQKGDTVFVEDVKWKTQYIDRWLHDSVDVVKEKPVEVEKIVTKEVEKKLNPLQKAVMGLGYMAMAVILCIIGFGLFKLRKR